MPDARIVYQDIFDHEHHVSAKHPQMPRLNRAAQFAPFAALTGYDDLIREAARETEALHSLDESEIEVINDTLVFLLRQEEAPEASFTCFVPDAKKAGGRYVTVTGRVSRYDAYENCIALESGDVIFVEDITQIECRAYSAMRDLQAAPYT